MHISVFYLGRFETRRRDPIFEIQTMVVMNTRDMAQRIFDTARTAAVGVAEEASLEASCFTTSFGCWPMS